MTDLIVAPKTPQQQAQEVMMTACGDGWMAYVNATAAAAVARALYIPVRIENSDQLALITAQLKNIKQVSAQIVDARKQMTRPLDAVKTYLIDNEKKFVAPLTQIETAVKAEMLRFKQAEEKKAADEKARKEAEVAENNRLQAEALAAAAPQDLFGSLSDPDDPRTMPPSGQDIFNQVFENAGGLSGAVELMVVADAKPKLPKEAKVSTMKTYEIIVEDMAKALAYVLAHPELMDVLQVNERRLKELAAAANGDLGIDGIAVKVNESVRV